MVSMTGISTMAEAIALAPSLTKDQLIVVNASGRGEKDLFITMNKFQPEALQSYIKTLQK